MAGAEDVVDLTDEGGVCEQNAKPVLQCKDVKMGKDKQLGELSLCGRFLTFTPASGSSAIEVKVDAKCVQSMQVSKAGSAKVLLRIVAPPSAPDVTFDLSAVLNGGAWRDSFKEAMSKLVSKYQPSSTKPKPDATKTNTTTTPSTPSSSSSSSQRQQPTTAPQQGSLKAAGGSDPKQGGGGEKAKSETVTATVKTVKETVRSLDAAEICSYLKEYPKLATIYRQQVPLKMTEQEFWRRFLLAKHVQEGAGEGAKKGGNKVLASLEADAPAASNSSPPPKARGGGHSNLDLTSMETASTLRPPPPELPERGGAEGGENRRSMVIGYVNSHQQSVLADIHDPSLPPPSSSSASSSARKRSRPQEALGGRQAAEHLAPQAKQAAIPLRLKSNPPLEKSGPPPEPEPTTTDGAEAKRTRKEEGGASGILGGGGVDLNQWELAQQRAGASGGVSETVMESFQRGVEADTWGRKRESQGGRERGLGAELLELEGHVGEVLRHVWGEVLSGRGDAGKLAKLSRLGQKLMTQVQDRCELLERRRDAAMVGEEEYYVELTKLADLRAKLAAPKVMDAPDPAGIALPSNLTLVK